MTEDDQVTGLPTDAELLAEIRAIGRIGGWAPGDYLNRCISCSRWLLGDKRSFICLPCTIRGLAAKYRPPPDPYIHLSWNELRLRLAEAEARIAALTRLAEETSNG